MEETDGETATPLDDRLLDDRLLDDRLLDDLEDALGAGSVLRAGRDVLDRYLEPARGRGGPAAAVLRPATTAQVCTVVRRAVLDGFRLLPQGANTGLVGASVPPTVPSGSDPRPIVVLSTERLVDPIEVFADDRVAIVPAGVRLSTLNDRLAPLGLSLPIDLGADPCLGAMVATDTGGARMLAHGDMRRRVLGVEAVLADVGLTNGSGPTVIDDLTRLRKDNTGPRLTSLMVGSGGAFGVVTRVAVELARVPRETACGLLAPVDAAAALDALRILEDALGPLLSAYEVVSDTALDLAVDHIDGLRSPWGDRSPAPEVMVLVEAAGPIGTAEVLADAVAALDDAGVVDDAVLVPTDRAWHLRHSITEGLARAGTVVGFDVSVPRSELVAFRDDVRERLATTVPRAVVADFGHWADGGTHCNLVFTGGPPGDSERADARRVVFGTAVDDHHGSYSAEHGIGPHNADWWIRTTPPGDRAVLRSLRERCDPHRVLGHPALPF
ncbi:MAG TPA: FAD-binding oxidoreductase [Microthrixaceae bacterium]|nr:FAD-binding oxidoreductase [Microthrixaceae bacterium]